MRTVTITAAGLLALVLVAPRVSAQGFEAVGTRAQGMAGAFVAMADDASAVYWNPAGLAGGAYFSLVLDGGASRAMPDSSNSAASSRSGWLLALTTPALGLSYYRLQSTIVRPPAVVPAKLFQVDSLVTQHVGATLVQSLSDGVAVATTLKVIRGVAASASLAGSDREALLGTDLIGQGSNKVDLDVGIMAAGSLGRAGLTIRNLSEPEFATGGTDDVRLERQIRGGVALLLLQSWKIAADLDLTKNAGPFGDLREMALGTEGQLTRRIAARGGVRFNTAGGSGRAPAVSAGGSFAILGSVLIDAQVTAGAEKAFRGWGVAGRMVF